MADQRRCLKGQFGDLCHAGIVPRHRHVLLSTTDARGKKLFFGYDDLGRKTTERSGSADGELMVRWEYDQVPNAIGRPSGSIRYVGGESGDAYGSYIGGYDERYRPLATTTILPEAEGKLAEWYSFTTSYNPDDTVAGYSLPKVGETPAENLTITYDDINRPVKLTGMSAGDSSQPYVTDTDYDVLGKPLQYELVTGAKKAWTTNTYSNGWQRLEKRALPSKAHRPRPRQWPHAPASRSARCSATSRPNPNSSRQW